MMLRRYLWAALALFTVAAQAHAPNQPPHQSFALGDLLNPEYEPIETSRYIRDVRVVRISPGTITGHASAGGSFPADVDFLNREVSVFLNR